MQRSTLAGRFIAYLACLKGLCAGLGFKPPAPCGFECAVDGHAADLIAAGR